MEYGSDDSSGTDDDLPPSHYNKGVRGPIRGNGRTIISAFRYSRLQNDMEIQIHRIEQEAYSSVLRAFKAQSDTITWEKESLITELRKELRVSDQEHRELLSRVNADDVIQRIREWRQAGGVQSGIGTNAQPDVTVPNPTVSASRKKQKISQSLPSLLLGASSPGLHTQFSASMQPSPSTAKKDNSLGTKGKKTRSGGTTPGLSLAAMQYLANGRGQVANRSTSGSLIAGQPAEPPSFDPLIGRKVRTRWPEDNNFYEAVLVDYNPVEGLHALVYDIGTLNETWEWVNLKEISSEDIIWEGDYDDPGTFHQSSQGLPTRGVKKTTHHGYVPRVGRGFLNNQKKELSASQNAIDMKNISDMERIGTDILVKEVERLLSATNPDPQEFDKAKKMLQEHEQVLIDAIAQLAQVSDDENDKTNCQLTHGLTLDQDPERRNQHYDKENDLAVEEREGIVGNELVTDIS
ncbi:protein EMSY-LIKE 3-like isoform X1 [Zingiber officinale]|uniref:protein EMSY-LIKE 3-like isoform X1 n=1 Tax=Zingiber officinale TaxID=94328 RepID=UPI001C4BB970|nr:protein EMSY-LIKE 3-like isoform X1 [Zingiber officinale]